MNVLILKGRITSDPELKESTNGKSYVNFSIAVPRKFVINCVAFGGTAEFVSKYFRKGQEIICKGELQIDKYQKDGENRTSAKCIVNSVEFCGKKSTDTDQQTAENTLTTSNSTDANSTTTDINNDLDGFVPVDDIDLTFM